MVVVAGEIGGQFSASAYRKSEDAVHPGTVVHSCSSVLGPPLGFGSTWLVPQPGCSHRRCSIAVVTQWQMATSFLKQTFLGTSAGHPPRSGANGRFFELSGLT